MLIRNSLKQMLRTPGKTLLFLILLLLSTGLLTTGMNLWQTSEKGIQEFKSLFNTIALVQQKEDTTEVMEFWDAATQSFSYFRGKAFSKWVDADVLNFDGAECLAGPRKRPYFGAYLPKVLKYSDEETERRLYNDWLIVLEVTPITSGPANPIQVEVTKSFCKDKNMVGTKVWICDHHNPDPITLEVGKTYIVKLNGPLGNHKWQLNTSSTPEGYEYFITSAVTSTQAEVNAPASGATKWKENAAITEVTPGFYETELGKAWMESAREQELFEATVPVQPVDKTILLKAFFNKTASVTKGRDISEQEYKEGEHVCLVPESMAEYNNWSIGDTIELPLYFANYANAPIQNWHLRGEGLTFSFLNNDLKVYDVFDQDTYKIVGVYTMKNYVEDAENGLSKIEIIIPYLSVTNSWKDNIIDSSQMKASTTSFEIPNGTIDDYMELWAEQGIDNIEIKFFDRGYSKLEAGIENRRTMGYILLFGGIIVTILILLFFCHLFIAKQKERTAVERCMGITKGKCARSLLSGLMLIVLLGVAAGSIMGYLVSKRITAGSGAETYYDETYSNGYVEKTSEKELLQETTKNQCDLENGAVAAAIFVIVASGVISGSYMKKSLKKEPLYLLSRSEE